MSTEFQLKKASPIPEFEPYKLSNPLKREFNETMFNKELIDNNDEEMKYLNDELKRFKLPENDVVQEAQSILLKFGKISAIPKKLHHTLNVSQFVFGKENIDQMEISVSKNLGEVLNGLEDLDVDKEITSNEIPKNGENEQVYIIIIEI